MQENTDRLSIKKMAKSFVYLPIKKTDMYPLFLSHPIFSTPILTFHGKVVDITEEPEELEEMKKEMCHMIDRQKSVVGISMLITKPYRLTFLRYIKPFLSLPDFSTLLSTIWIDSENPNQDVNVPVNMIAGWFREADPRILMSKEEFEVYDQLPDDFTVYRGVACGRNPSGLSWTRNKKLAEWFAHRFDTPEKKGYVRERRGKKGEVLAYFSHEEEIVMR